MKSQTLILLIVAAGCGLVAMLGVQQTLKQKGGDETPKVRVLRASADIEIGERLNELNCEYVMVDVDAVPEGAITDLKQTEERTLLIPANAGDWITERKLSERGMFGGVVNIPEGMQVCTIPVDATTCHSGMLQPGHRVDLMITYQTKNEAGERIRKVRRILQYVEVYAVDDKIYGRDQDDETGRAKNISLLVTPEQALFLELAKTQGRMSTVLRRTDDASEVACRELSESDLDGGDGPSTDLRTSLDANANIEDAETERTEGGLEDIFADLRAGFSDAADTGPVAVQEEPAEDRTWTIVIWEGADARLESVSLDSDLPVPSGQNAPVLPGPAAGRVAVPPAISGPPASAGAPGKAAGETLFEGLRESIPELWNVMDR